MFMVFKLHHENSDSKVAEMGGATYITKKLQKINEHFVQLTFGTVCKACCSEN